MSSLTKKQLEVLTYTVLGEAAGEGFDGMAAVAHVIFNRAEDGRYSSDPAIVAKQPKQFSTWNDGDGGNDPFARYAKGSGPYKRAEQAVKAAFSGAVPDPTGNAVMYWSPKGMKGGVDPYWADEEETKHGRVAIKGHVFLARTAVLSKLDVKKAPVPAVMSTSLTAQRSASTELTTRSVKTVRVDDLGLPISDVQYAANEAARRKRNLLAVTPVKPALAIPPPTLVASARSSIATQRTEQLSQRVTPKAPAIVKTAGGIAGTVQLPRSVIPKAAAAGVAQATAAAKGQATVAPSVKKPAGDSLVERKAVFDQTADQVEAASGFRVSRTGVRPAPALPAPEHDDSKRLKTGAPLEIAAPKPKDGLASVPIGTPLNAGSRDSVANAVAGRAAAAAAAKEQGAALASAKAKAEAAAQAKATAARAKAAAAAKARADAARAAATRAAAARAAVQQSASRAAAAAELARRTGGVVINGAVYGSGGSSYGSNPGQITAGLKPGDQTYNADTNSWGLKM